MIVAGGFLDLQINGGWGHHFSDDPSSVWAVGEQLMAHGVTAFLPTLISEGFDRLDEALDTLSAGPPEGWVGAEPLGLHLEGPWLNPSRRGAHRPSALRPPVVPDRLRCDEGVRLVTLAPELPGALDAVSELVSRGVTVSCGHSDASLEEADAGFTAGIGMGTHLFNAMSGLHHRSPGVAAALLTNDEVAFGMIVDGAHVAPPMVALAWRLAAERFVVVSDAVSLLGITDEAVARRSDGTLLGATVGIDQGVRNLMAFTGCSLDAAAAAASTRPRAVLGVAPREGDWTELDDAGRVIRTAIGGDVVFDCSAAA